MNPTLFRSSKEQCKKSHITEEELVSQFVRTGQRDLLGQLYSRCYNRVYHQCHYMVKDRVLAQDCTHDIFLKIIPKLSTFKQGSRFSSWLFSVTYNHCLDQFRASRRKSEITIDGFAELVDDSSWDSYSHDEPCRVDKLLLAFSSLPSQERSILRMRYTQNLSHSDIAEKFNISLSAAKMRLLRIRRKLRRDMLL